MFIVLHKYKNGPDTRVPAMNHDRALMLAANSLIMAFHDAIPVIRKGEPGWHEVQLGFDILADGKRTLPDRLTAAAPLWASVRRLARAELPPLLSVEVQAVAHAAS